MNERIRVREILVIDDNGEKLGVMSPREALDIARSKGLDLIEVAPQAQPPVCRILDYGKFKYEQGKREREAAKKSRQSELKGMTLTPRIDDHDLEMKIKNVVKFLSDGDKVKVAVRFRSREMSHPEFAQAALEKMVSAMLEAGVGVVERPPLMEGKQMIMILAPQREGAAKKPVTPKPAPAGPRPVEARPTTDGPRPTTDGPKPTVDGAKPTTDGPRPMATEEPRQVTTAAASATPPSE
ncbi:MAG: translation initiation factor IF-3 [Capsulimonadales bacterium]|nr:translation initiation factor IF-3 [Capsulimonadales bacterium]